MSHPGNMSLWHDVTVKLPSESAVGSAAVVEATSAI